MENQTASIVFRLDANLKKEFDRIARAIDITPSQLLRAYVRDLVADHNRKNGQKDLLKDGAPTKPEKQPKLNRAERREIARRHKND